MWEVNGLEQVYTETAKILKAISDPKRLRIGEERICGASVDQQFMVFCLHKEAKPMLVQTAFSACGIVN